LKGLLADVNVQGHLPYIRQCLAKLDILPLLEDLGIRLATFSDLRLSRDLSDRLLWDYCQQHQWVLFTENRNDDGTDSLNAVLADSWEDGNLPVITLANKGRFENDASYAELVVDQLAGILVDSSDGKCCDRPRIYVPFAAVP
jgi:hypothetical protein